MPNLNFIDHQPPGGVTPEMGRIHDAVATFGVSRTWLYRAAPQHPGLLKKLDRTTLVDYRVLREILATLPDANIRPARRAA